MGIVAPAIAAVRPRPAVCCSSLRGSLGSSVQQRGTASFLQRQPSSSRPRRDRGRQIQPCVASAAVWAAAAFDAPAPGGGGDAVWEPAMARRFPAFLAAIRAVLFYTTTFVFAAPLFLFMLLVYPYVLKFDKYR